VKSTGQPWEPLTLWQEDTPANPSVMPAVEPVPTTHDTSGQCSQSVFAWFDPDTRCWKTCQGTFLSDLEMFKPIWPRSGMTRDGIAYQLPPSAPRTSAIAYSSSLHGEMQWTPTAKANQDSPSMEARAPGRHLWPTPTTHARESSPNRDGGPSLATAARLWPTPVARDYKGAGMRGQLPTTVSEVEGSGKLNPVWVEWLMGFPIGWTDLED